MKVNFKKLNVLAVQPYKSHIHDAGFDIIGVSFEIKNDLVIFKTGLALEIPEGYAGLIFPRSSIRKTDLRLSNSVGLIDSTYRGEIQVTFDRIKVNGDIMKSYEIGDRIAQLVIIKIPSIELAEVDNLTETERGEGGHGSTGT